VGVGAELRHALGTAVFAGMIGVAAFGVDLHPGVLRHLPVARWARAQAEADGGAHVTASRVI
jgi:hypothetical protein